MAQFDVYRNPDESERERVPYILDVQSDLLRDLRSRVVVPLEPATPFNPPLPRLNPALTVEGRSVRMITQELAPLPVAALSEPVASMASSRYDIVGAVDVLVSGV